MAADGALVCPWRMGDVLGVVESVGERGRDGGGELAGAVGRTPRTTSSEPIPIAMIPVGPCRPRAFRAVCESSAGPQSNNHGSFSHLPRLDRFLRRLPRLGR